jgi:hypothetical protein
MGLQAQRRRRRKRPGTPAIEVYLGPGRYFATTGHHWPGTADDVALLDRDTLLTIAELVQQAIGNAAPGDKREGSDTSRSAAAFRLGAKLRRAGATFEEMCQAIRTNPQIAEWCRDKGEKYNGRELRRIWDNADPGLTPEALAQRKAKAEQTQQQVIAWFNQHHMVVNEAGRAVIFFERLDHQSKRWVYDRMRFDDFRKLYCNRFAEVLGKDGELERRQITEIWLMSRDRREYTSGVTFDPAGNAPPHVLNLWRGFAIQPKRGDWPLLREHLLSVICDGDTATFDYLFGLLATMMQHPERQGEVAIVLQGEEGTGKGTLARLLLRIFGQHGTHISQPEHLTGRFNGHLRDCCFLFCDEAFFAGDRAHVGALKRLITEPTITIEGKYQAAVLVPNMLHLVMASNERCVVPAGMQSRRFFVLVASDKKIGDFDYFAELQNEIDNGGGAEAFLDDLLNFPLSKFNARAVPRTEGLNTQRHLTLAGVEAWWLDTLHRGYVCASRHGLEDDLHQWMEVVSTELLYCSYRAYVREHHERRPLPRAEFGGFLNKVAERSTRPQRLIVGERMMVGGGGPSSGMRTDPAATSSASSTRRESASTPSPASPPTGGSQNENPVSSRQGVRARLDDSDHAKKPMGRGFRAVQYPRQGVSLLLLQRR